MINKKVVEKFLKRKLSNHDWLKTLDRKVVLSEFARELELLPELATLWTHQIVSLLCLLVFNRFLLHLDMGGGKTSIILFSILLRKLKGEKPKAIVFVPYVSAVDTWVEECKLRTPALKLVPLVGTKIENLRKLEEGDGEVFVICYASAVAMLAIPTPKKRGKGNKWILDPKRIRAIFSTYDTSVFDEVHKCSDILSLTYRISRQISTQTKYCMALSGTPFGKAIEDIWGQFYLVDFGETLGDTKGLFLEAFFKRKPNYFSGFDEFVFDKSKMPILKQAIKNSSIHYDAGEMHDLPQKRYIKRTLKISKDINGYVEIARAQFKDAAKATDFSLAQASYLQLRQLASGFMTVNGDNTKLKIAFDHNPKLDLLEEYIDAMPWGCKMVVFHHFVYTSQLISDRLKKLKIGHARVWSGQKDTLGELKRFREDENCRVMVLNDQSGSSSLNLQHANYMFFFEQPDSAINRTQGEKRIYRAGQAKPVWIIDPFMDGTVDERIFHSNRQGKKLLDQLLKGEVKL